MPTTLPTQLLPPNPLFTPTTRTPRTLPCHTPTMITYMPRPPLTPSPPADYHALTTVTSLGGYHSEPTAPAPRPTLTSILKKYKDDQISPLNRLSNNRNTNSSNPSGANTINRRQPIQPRQDNSRHHFLPIIPDRPRAGSRPYISAPRPYDVDGTPWCEACTAQLSDDDLNTPGLRDPEFPDIRYRLRMDHDQPPTHSNSHSDLTRIHRTNAAYHRDQRESTESQQVRTGILPSLQTHTSYVNTPDASDIAAIRSHYGTLPVPTLPLQRGPPSPRYTSPRLRIQQPQHHQHDPRRPIPTMVPSHYLAFLLLPRRSNNPV